jgi:hypothetical protein
MSDVRYIIRHGRRIAVETQPDPPELAAKIRKRAQRQQEAFAIVPLWWVKRLRQTRCIATYRVALHVLYQNYKAGGKAFTLSNVAMAEEGVTPRQKWRALQELETLGLISIKRRKRRTPLIAVITTTEKG